MPPATPPAAVRRALADRSTALWRAYLAAGSLATGAYFALASRPRIQDAAYDLVGLGAVAALFAGVRRSPGRGLGRSWNLIACGILAFVLGDVCLSVFDLYLERDPPYRFLSDTFYLAGYPLLAAGLVVVIRRIDRGRGWTSLIDAGIFATAFSVAGWVFVMDPLARADYPVAERAIWLAYPSMDLVLAAVLARLLLTRSRNTAAFRQLAAAVLLQLAADVAYYGGFSTGVWTSACWLLSYVLWGGAALHPSGAWLGGGLLAPKPRLSRHRLAGLASALLAGPVMLLALTLSGREVQVVPIAIGSGVVSLLVLARLAGLIRSVERTHAAERMARTRAEASERLLAEQNERLRELDRDKDVFVSLVSHELRTPLTSIIGYLELLRDESEGLADEQRQFVAVAHRNSERLHRLVEDLLFVAQLEAGRLELDPTDVDLAELARAAVDAARPAARERGVELAVHAEPVFLRGDGTRLGQVLDNLVANAVKFTPEGGSVTVRAVSEEDAVVVTVTDTGVGIPAEEQRRLFERFFRASTATERQIPGTGLGLAIVKAIVEAHGGDVSVVSGVDLGTTFRVRLPGVAAARAGGQDDVTSSLAA